VVDAASVETSRCLPLYEFNSSGKDLKIARFFQ
jgi:hypothetical protein